MTPPFRERVKEVDPRFLQFQELKTLQVNLGNLCNLRCAHCHIDGGPAGDQLMGVSVMSSLVSLLESRVGLTLDITGGCPEMNPNFRYLVERTEGLSPRRILRSNLAIMTEPGMEWLPEFCREHRLVVTASLPCYLQENVDGQRGPGVYARSIATLKELNRLGYGSDLELNLVYNPGGAFLPGSQKELEAAYRHELDSRHGLVFSNLYTITNAPIGRFRRMLEKNGRLERYLTLLAERFNGAAAGNIMCRTLISVDWRGILYNCDFNQALEMPILGKDRAPLTVRDLQEVVLDGTDIQVADHCYCCTAGEGSSCTGVLAA